MSTTPIVLVDMDGVLADLETGFYDRWAARFPDRPQRPQADPTQFLVADQVGRRWFDDVRAITCEPGFYLDLPVINGAAEAMNAMLDAGWNVRICTAPLTSNPTCASDKLEWAYRHLGDQWSKRVIIAKDKTLVRGDLLIDDKPAVTGDLTPTWSHVVFDQPYNRQAPSPLRLSRWQDWTSLAPLLGRTAA